MFPPDLMAEATALITALRQRGLRLATAESCTGGLIAALMTELPGSSDVFDRGFVTYTNDAKTKLLGVPDRMISELGAVSAEVARAMADAAIANSQADVSVAVTGVAGPGGGTVLKPVGLVHLAAGRRGAATLGQECRFGAISRSEIRLATVRAALSLIRRAIELPATGG